MHRKATFFRDVWHLDSPRESGEREPTFRVGCRWLRSSLPEQEQRGAEPSSERRARGSLLNSPARRRQPVICSGSADADPQQHVLRGPLRGDNRLKGSWRGRGVAQ